VGCYFAAINYSYRFVFAIFMAPFLWSAWALASEWPSTFRRAGRTAAALVLTALWIDGLACLLINLSGRLNANELDRWTDRLVLLEQPLTAALIFCLLGFLVAFTRDSSRAMLNPRPNERPAAAPLPYSP
jgi:hypothetical protein